MNESQIVNSLRSTFGEKPISTSEIEQFLTDHNLDTLEPWLEYDEEQESYFLSHETLTKNTKDQPSYEALGLGEVEEVIVNALERGKTIPWGKVALAMWIFFLFIVVYTVMETVF